jgi:hypothetical protein
MKTICDNYKEIQALTASLKCLAKNSGQIKDVVNLQDIIGDMLTISDLILSKSEQMRNNGIKMEERLREYRKAIEGLGFKKID